MILEINNPILIYMLCALIVLYAIDIVLSMVVKYYQYRLAKAKAVKDERMYHASPRM